MVQPTIVDQTHFLQELAGRRPEREILNFLHIDSSRFDQWKQAKVLLTPAEGRELVRYCLQQELTDVLERNATGLPSYNPYAGFSFNTLPIGFYSPFSASVSLRRMPAKIAGRTVGFPIGVPASILTGTSQWIDFYAQRGFDIITYKTVRTVPWRVHPRPHLVFIPEVGSLAAADVSASLAADREFLPENSQDASAANSFGIPSQLPDEWQEDVNRVTGILKSDQVLIVSVTGTTLEEDKSFEYLVEDFVKAASMARDAGADIVELNLSCPNVSGDHAGELFRFPEESKIVVEEVWDRALGRGTVPLLVKIGYLAEPQLKALVELVAPYVHGVVAINTVARKIVGKVTDEAYFPDDHERKIDRSSAGVSGSAIRDLAQEVVRNLSALRDAKGYEYDILAVGGVSSPQHFQDYLNLGANGVLSCTGALLDVELAIKVRHTDARAREKHMVDIETENAGREVKVMKKELMQEEDELLPEIEPGYSQRKPMRLIITPEIIEQIVKRTKIAGVRDLLRNPEDKSSKKEKTTR